ncbi:O-antigen ligase [Asticcacaulis sp. YBE204]|uniref:O-antigen ligase family protein n=1 Tax=Asticcacaulis sp. YBE204 TaxID=1282363 RepID=UPI0003C3CB21|nr:O-antigen ligase [Asticcacaulis sp. YBE204]ESQ80144.1 polymerase [Asticcacaulis sp. YBE204]
MPARPAYEDDDYVAPYAQRNVVPSTQDTPLDGLALWIYRAEILLACFCVFMFTEALWAPLFAPNQETGGDVAWMRLLWLPVYGLTLLLCALRADRFLRILPALFMGGLLIGLCYASGYWSIDPAVTSRRSLALAFTTLFGLYLGMRFKGSDLTQIVALTFTVLAVGSILAALFYPTMGVHHDINAGAWRGLWHEKNQMASLMTFGFVAACASAFIVPERRTAWIVAAALIFFLVVMSRSKTSLLACMLSLFAMPVLMALKRGGILSVLFVWAAATVSLIGGTLFFLMPEAIFKALGKDPTLTGRTEIWESLLRLSDKRPWLGYGYKAFWGPDSVPNKIVKMETHWDVPSAHNGWLDLLVQLGWLGVILFGSVLAIAFFCALFRFARVKDGFFSVLTLCLFSFLILSESFILGQNTLIWVLFICAMSRLTANRLQDT